MIEQHLLFNRAPFWNMMNAFESTIDFNDLLTNPYLKAYDILSINKILE